MILQALNQYYERLLKEEDSGIALTGFAPQKISYAIILDKNGNFQRFIDIQNYERKKPQPVEIMLPYIGKRTSGIRSNFLWDNTKYVLGVDEDGNTEKKGAFDAFKQLHCEIQNDLNNDELNAVVNFLDKWNPKVLKNIKNWEDICGKNIIFKIENSNRFVHNNSEIVAYWIASYQNQDSDTNCFCLVTGEYTQIEKVHFPIKGIYDPGGQAEKAIISFNKQSFCSYGKEQSCNAPVGSKAMFAYTTALNYLLRFDSKQKIQIGNVTTVFWTERDSPVESIWGATFNPGNSNIQDNRQVYEYLCAVRSGKKPKNINTSVKMYILGLSPNASRLSVRFWIADTIDGFNKHLQLHLNNIQIEKKYSSDSDFPGIWHLLIETLPKKKSLRKTENINPLLSGSVTRAVLSGGRYPESLLATIITRIRADGDISYYRSAMIKAILIKNYSKEVSMSLDENNTNVAYCLGRLFAVLEKAQEEAIPGANATIKDRFYGSASATPGVVFPQLLRLSQHHLSKIGGGNKVNKEKLIQRIVEDISTFPKYLTLEEQGLFSLGYYHQRNAFFKRKNDANSIEIKDKE